MDLYGGNPQPLIIENIMKAIYREIKIIPSHLSSKFLFRPVNMVRNNSVLAKITTIRSMFNLLSKGNGLMIALIPRIKKILNIFEPTIFPTAISAFFLKAAMVEVTSSGREVPIATTVNPIKV
jgi:hypothetical protein